MKSKFSIFKFLLIVSGYLLFLIPGVYSQSISVNGSIEDENNTPLIGVNIIEKGTTNGSISDVSGRFSITVSPNATLIFSYIGFGTIEVPVEGRNIIPVTMASEKEELDELVVVGYTTMKKADLTGAVSVVDLSEVADLPTGNIIKNIQGRVAGVSVTTDGSPGSGATIRIRGTGTINNNDPLFVIDGIPTKAGMHELNSSDIASIQVLKDASAASIYGSRAGNGVIIITTKNANQKGTKVEFSADHTFQRYNTKLDPLNTYERGLVFWKASVNDHLNPISPIYKYVWNGDLNNPILGAINLPEYIDAAKTMKPADTRWFDEVSQPSLQSSYNLSIASGEENRKFLFSLGYYDNDGIVKSTNFKRFNARFNSEFGLLNNKVKIGENFTMSYQRETLINASDILFNSLVQQPIVPVHTETGGWGGPASGMTDRQNPVRLIEDNIQNHYSYVRPFGNAYIQVEPVRNLILKSSYGIDYSLYYLRQLQKSYRSGFLVEPDATVRNNTSLGGNWIWSNTANWIVNIGLHKFNTLVGFERIRYSSQWFDASRENYVSEDFNFTYLGSGDAATQLNNGSGSLSALQSFFGQLNYSYADKYLASLTFRHDGSTRFLKSNSYANFPAASVGWRMSEESFIKDNLSFPLYLKLRASWGQNGSQDGISNNAIYNIYRVAYGKEDPIWDNPNPPVFLPALGTAYDITGIDQGQLLSGFITTQQGNDDLRWETTTQTNLGIDFAFLDNFSGSADYYIKETKDLLYLRLLPAAVGEAGFQYVNGGNIRNKGLEFVFSYDKSFGDFKLNVSANMATLKNEVIDMPDDITFRVPISGMVPNETKSDLSNDVLLGQSINSIYGYVCDGIFQNQDEVNNHAVQTGKGIGRLRFKDLNGDTIINYKDQRFIGVADPGISYGLNIDLSYKAFSLSMFWQGIQGMDVYNSYKTYTDFTSLWPGTNWGRRVLDGWSPENTSSTIPAVTTIDNNNEGRISTYFIESGSYLKLRNLQLSYNLPKSLLEKILVKNGRVYLLGQNLLTLKNKNSTIPDPENPNYAFPIPTSYTIGINLTF
jgi:TonB-linked SusC/RagA family outer membrane protein